MPCLHLPANQRPISPRSLNETMAAPGFPPFDQRRQQTGGLLTFAMPPRISPRSLNETMAAGILQLAGWDEIVAAAAARAATTALVEPATAPSLPPPSSSPPSPAATSAAQPPEAAVLLDPMCGSGTFLIEVRGERVERR